MALKPVRTVQFSVLITAKSNASATRIKEAILEQMKRDASEGVGTFVAITTEDGENVDVLEVEEGWT